MPCSESAVFCRVVFWSLSFSCRRGRLFFWGTSGISGGDCRRADSGLQPTGRLSRMTDRPPPRSGNQRWAPCRLLRALARVARGNRYRAVSKRPRRGGGYGGRSHAGTLTTKIVRRRRVHAAPASGRAPELGTLIFGGRYGAAAALPHAVKRLRVCGGEFPPAAPPSCGYAAKNGGDTPPRATPAPPRLTGGDTPPATPPKNHR